MRGARSPGCPQLVGRGTSVRRSSQTVRLEAQKFVEDESGMRHASRERDLAARYLDLFGAEIDHELAPRRWPQILVLDSKPFGLRPHGAAEHGERWDPNARAGAVLVAVDGNDRTRTPKAAVRLHRCRDRLSAWATEP